MRSRTSETWATVNESVAPNEYSVPTKFDVAGQEDQDRSDAGEDDEREPRAS